MRLKPKTMQLYLFSTYNESGDKIVTHLHNGVSHGLCGQADDENPTGEEPKHGSVTCSDCRREAYKLKQAFKRFKIRPLKD